MKSSQLTSSILFALFVVLLTGCKAREAANNNAAKPNPAVSSTPSSAGNSNQPVQTASSNDNSNASKGPDAPEKGKDTTPPALVGTYESREVQKEGVVTLISQLQTSFVFTADGRYSRKSTVKGKTYHSDSGQFRIDTPDKLVLSIQVTGEKAKQKVQTPPVEKVHRFSLSPDGDELRLTSEKGSIGIFRRVAKPKAS
jgi:hypothetical protein